MKPRILTGIRPTGALHIGHYFGMLEQTAALQEEFDVFLMIADVQALTDNFHQPEKVRANVLEVALGMFSSGVDPKKSTVFIQSLVPEIAELTVFLSNLVTVAQLQQNPTVKTEIAQKRALFGESVTYGFLGYPVSQAADIVIFDAALVPVGDDQLPMLEQTRAIVRKFNAYYGETLLEPRERLVSSGRLRGLDGGEKMGKSLGNAMFLNDSSADVSSKVMNAVTDPQKVRLKDPGRPEVCTVYAYHELFSKVALPEIAQTCRDGTRGCVTCKRELIANINEFLEPMRQKRSSLETDEVMQTLLEGTRKARAVARTTLARVKRAMKLDYEPIYQEVA
jgi:tryptophanyl-tRNA synthetase